MTIEMRDISRWFKKGFLYLAGFTVVSALALKFASVTGLYPILDKLVTDPMGELPKIFDWGVQSLVWAFAILPVLGGWFIEEVDKRIRK